MFVLWYEENQMKKIKCSSFIVAVLTILSVSLNSQAFHLGDHSMITRQALSEFQKCFPGELDRDEPFFVISSDLEEDLNIVRKDIFFSHYFNPQKNLPMARQDSLARIDQLNRALKIDKNSILLYIHLGHAIHHIQDMATPAHVIPVEHGPFDSFEQYDMKNKDISSGLSCQELAVQAIKVRDLQSLLVQAAQETLKSVTQISLMITATDSKGSQSYPIDGTAFWKSAPGDGFGSYGPMGKHYGETDINFVNGKVKTTADFYESFKHQRMQMAVTNTLLALYFFHKPTGTKKTAPAARMDLIFNFYSLPFGFSFEGLVRAFSLSGI